MRERNAPRCPPRRSASRAAASFGGALLLVGALLGPEARTAQAQPPLLSVYEHPDPTTGLPFFRLAQAHRLMARGNPVFAGERRIRKRFGGMGGVLDLATVPVSGGRVQVDFGAFATCRTGETSPVVLSGASETRLTKAIPGSNLYPMVYQAQAFIQSGTNIRTHWTLLYTQPGTTFTLDVRVRCTSLATGLGVEHLDRYVWLVVADLDTLRALVDALHTDAIGTSELPPIVAESRYLALHAAIDQIDALVTQGSIAGAKAAIATLQADIAGASDILGSPERPVKEVLGVTLEYIHNQLP
jgi:hypothetical protein